jgi:hypothetical protein
VQVFAAARAAVAESRLRHSRKYTSNNAGCAHGFIDRHRGLDCKRRPQRGESSLESQFPIASLKTADI